MKNFLSDDERDRLILQHTKERDKRTCDRIKAILLYDKGWTLMQIAEALLLSDDAIRQHIKDYKASQKLKPESGGSFEDFKSAVMGFLESVSTLDPDCLLGQAFANRVRDKFRPIGAPITDF